MESIAASLQDWALTLGWSVASFFAPGEPISGINLMMSLMAVAVLYAVTTRYLAERPTFGAYVMPKEIWQHPSTKLDIVYYFLIQTFASLALVPLAAAFGWVSYGVAAGIEHLLGPSPLAIGKGWGALIYTVVVFIGLDFGFWYSHYLTHKRPFLWHFHKVHHSAEVLTPFSSVRFHPVDILWNVSFKLTFSSLLAGICRYGFYPDGGVYSLFGNNILVAVSYLTTHNLRHSHIWLDYPKWLRFLISPAQHQVHHSCEARHIDKNFGYVLACWDRMAGSLYSPTGREEFAVGVKGLPKEGLRSHRSLLSLLVAPFLDLRHERAKKRAASGKT